MAADPPDHPRRRASDSPIPTGAYPGVDPHLVAAIQNGVKLDRLIEDVTSMSTKVDTQALVTLAIKEHNTIAKADHADTSIGEVRFLLRVLMVLVGLVPVYAAGFAVGHGMRWW